MPAPYARPAASIDQRRERKANDVTSTPLPTSQGRIRVLLGHASRRSVAALGALRLRGEARPRRSARFKDPRIWCRYIDMSGFTTARVGAFRGRAPAELAGAGPRTAVARIGDEPDRMALRPGRLRSHLFSVMVVAAYAALAITAYWPLLSSSSQRLVVQVYGDPVQMVWFFGWTAHAITTAHNPFFSTAANAPYGVNMAQLTFAPLLGLLFAPLTLLAGPVSSVTVCFVMAMPLSAASAYAVLRRWNIWAPAAALGGLAYGFSPYMVNEGSQHLNLVFVPLPPLIVATLVKLLNRPHHPLRWGAALGGLTTAQYFISSEILTITAVVSIVGLLMAGAYWAETHPNDFRAAIGPALRGAVVAAAVAATLLSYPIWYAFAGPHHYTGPPWPDTANYNAHLSSFVAPTPRQLVHPALGATGARLYAASFLLDGAYLGWAVLAVVAVLLWSRRRSARIRLTAALGAFSALMSFGSYTYVNGRSVTLPFRYLSKLPTLSDILPVRFSFATTACVAALLAFALDTLRRSTVRGPKPAGGTKAGGWRANVALAVVCLVVGVTWLPAWPFPSQSVETLPLAVTRALPAGNPLVLAYPYPLTADDMAMLWQAEADFPFRLFGVYAMVPQLDGRPAAQSPLLYPPAVQEYLAAEEVGSISYYPAVSPLVNEVAQTRDFVVRQHVGAVLVSLSAPNATTVARTFSAALGPPKLTSGGFELWVTAH